MLQLTDAPPAPTAVAAPAAPRRAGRIAAAAATVAAATIFLETFTDPADQFEHYHEGLALPVNLVLFAAVVTVVVALTALITDRDGGLTRAGKLGGLAIVAGFALGDLPHSVIDFTVAPQLFAHLPHDQAKHLLSDHVDSAIGILSAPAILLLLGGIIALGRATLCTDRTGARILFCAIPAAIVLGALSAATDFAPHPPVALYLAVAVWATRWSAAPAGRNPARA